MRLVHVVLAAIILGLSPITALAQSSQSSGSVPRLINVAGIFRPADGQPVPATVDVTLVIYADQDGGAPLWQETQTVTLDKTGRFTVLLGATQTDGIPPTVFATADTWLGMQFPATGAEQPHVRLTSVPYALNAETLGGRPASDYLLAPAAGTTADTASNTQNSVATPAGELPGAPGAVAKYVDASNVGPSTIVETGGLVGIGTSTPFDNLHVKYTNTNGGMTGFAVQNMGNTATSYSGMLFYDQNNQLGQFQGFNNVTHEYRINNIATAPTGSINFMIGSTSRFFVGGNGNVGIGTTAPAVNFEVSNALSTTNHTLVLMTSYGNNSFGSATIGRKARGTAAAPTAVQNGDELATFGALGYGATAFSALSFAQGLSIRAAQNWTDTAQATSMSFSTTPTGAVQPATRMTITAAGDVGIGTSNPRGGLEVLRAGSADVFATSFGDDPSSFLTRTARGTPVAPTALQFGDVLGIFGGGGYGTTGFSFFNAGMVAVAGEAWTDTAQGTAVAFLNTPLGTIQPEVRMAILPTGNIGIGTPLDVNGAPIALDRLQVFGDVRVGTTGTNGCLKNFAGTGIAGTCASDRRFKKNITPFAPVLDQFAKLQPVHYFWRAADFPERHFGNSRNYGLIAQDVEQVLPELVVTNDDGFKAVDYSKLPLLTIQAVKELKTTNDTLKAENDGLKLRVAALEPLAQRVEELERLVAEILAKK